ncbi:hypothetical protein RLOC_00012772 [Lonchura striata]|uniref:Uncharacterized protein n=1 Tax=Lonchura striata TaxID=40157 RepID=A0A218V647_9PASE|nr:hypothetical protein RLOC_00012772 [Lonchura striata domestica]
MFLSLRRNQSFFLITQLYLKSQ